MMNDVAVLKDEALQLLKELVSLPSYSKEEWQTASAISKYLAQKGLATSRVGNNVFALNQHFDTAKPTMLLVSHHDTVKPNGGYTKDPFKPIVEGEKLFGLGTTDAGGALVSLMAAFIHYYQKDLKYNLVFVAAAEEEISGARGIQSVLPFLPKIDCALVGEPTEMHLAVAERGLVVLDCEAQGRAGHAARNEGENALYTALEDIQWIRGCQFPKVSPMLGPVQLSVTSIETANKAHNIVPDHCTFIVDVRVNELYTLEDVVEVVQHGIKSKVSPRSLRIRSTVIDEDHPLVAAGKALGRQTYGSPTTSDKALLPFPALKMGPGSSSRSHTADEFIYLREINEGIDIYIQLLNQLL